jgi:hypothetical protein
MRMKNNLLSLKSIFSKKKKRFPSIISRKIAHYHHNMSKQKYSVIFLPLFLNSQMLYTRKLAQQSEAMSSSRQLIRLKKLIIVTNNKKKESFNVSIDGLLLGS